MKENKAEQPSPRSKKEVLKEIGKWSLLPIALLGVFTGVVLTLPGKEEIAARIAEDKAQLSHELQAEQDMLKSKGVWGPLPLVALQGVTDLNVNGNVLGNAIFFGGSINGKSNQSEEFAWGLPDGRVILSELSSNKFYFEPQSPGENPDITMHFDMRKFDTVSYQYPDGLEWGTPRDLGDDLHAYITDENVITATVHLDSMSLPAKK